MRWDLNGGPTVRADGARFPICLSLLLIALAMEVRLHRESGPPLWLGKLQARAVALARSSGPNRRAAPLRGASAMLCVATHRPRHLRTFRSVVPTSLAICGLLHSGCSLASNSSLARTTRS